MMWTLLGDTISFCRRHARSLAFLVVPMYIILLFALEISDVETFFGGYIQEVAAAQEAAGTEGGEIQEVPPLEMPVLSLSSALFFLLYLVGSIYPTALIIQYVRRIFASQSSAFSLIYREGVPLWVGMCGLYLVTWGIMTLIGLSVFFMMQALGLEASGLSSMLMTVYFGACIYVHHRLSLAPYFYAQKRMPIMAALKLSWLYGQRVVLVLMLGNFIVYIGAVMLVSGITQMLEGVLPDNTHQLVQMGMSLLANIFSVIQIVFVYRVFAYITEEGTETGSESE